MSRIRIIDPNKCMRCRYHYWLGDSRILAYGCTYPVTTVTFDCSNRKIVSLTKDEVSKK